MADRYTRLNSSIATFSEMLSRFGVVTVMNAKIYNPKKDYGFKHYAQDFFDTYQNETPLATLDTLKISNFTEDGPTKTVNGGQYSNPLIKFGKTARLEMQDALGNSEALEALGAGLNEYSESGLSTRIAFHATDSFARAKVIIGDSFFIDQTTGVQVPVSIIIYQFQPDSLLNLTQDASGDAAVFDMNGDVLVTNITVGDKDGSNKLVPVFYSIISRTAA